MADEEQLAVVRQGVEAWNIWRYRNPGIQPNLSGADLYEADLSRANLSGAKLIEADLRFAHLYKADLSGADLIEAILSGANLSWADLSGANLSWVNLQGALLVGTKLVRADLTGCHIYGISAWDLKLDGAKQQDLIITPYDEPEITVDSLEVAQFIYLLLTNKKIREVIDTITTKVVLILGRFTPERKAVLDALREELRKRDRTPIVFDFDQPESKNVTDTVKLLAQLARYIIVDLSDPNSAPYELGIISMLGLDSTPMVPLIVSGQRPFPMLDDVLRKPWSTQLVRYRDLDDIRANLDEMLIEIAEAKVQDLRGVSPPTA
jgi:Pentapeptide repeats (8 copies)